MTSYLASIWKCRYFWLSLVQMDLRNRYRRSALGMGWSLLHPIVMTCVLCLVFHRIFNLNVVEYAPYLLAGMCFWNFITAVTNQGCHCLFQGEAYIRQYPAPMAIYPLRTVLGGMVHFLLALIVVFAVSNILRGPISPLSLLSLIPTLLLLFILGWSLAVIMGFSTAYFPDMQHLAEVGLSILFYATPIIYTAKMLREKGLGWIADLNPLGAVLELLREPLLYGQFPTLNAYLVALATVSVILVIAITMLVRLQNRIIFQL